MTHLGTTDEEDQLYFDFCHDLTGSESDQRRHALMRKAFLYLLRRDPHVLEFFRATSAQTGMDDALTQAVSATAEFARVLGIQRHEVFRVADWPTTITKANGDPRMVIVAGYAAIDAVRRFDDRLLDSASSLGERALSFVIDDLKLPWPWLCMEILFIFNCELVSCLYGRRFEIVPTFNPPSPAIDCRLQIPAGSKSEAFRQLDAFYKQIRAEIEGGTRQERTPDVQKMARYSAWFYRYRIKGESIRRIAQAYHRQVHPEKSNCSGDRSTVQYGIDECCRILSLPRFAFLDIPSPCRN